MQSLKVLLSGMAIGAALALVLATVAVTTRLGADVLETLTAMFNPLPAIALMPLALLWFGLGVKSVIFVIVHSVLWPMALNTYTGFVAVPQTLRRVGQNFGPHGLAAGGGDPPARGVSVSPLGHQDRLGLRVADDHRGRDGVRRGGQPGRARLVHLPEPLRDEHATSSSPGS